MVAHKSPITAEVRTALSNRVARASRIANAAVCETRSPMSTGKEPVHILAAAVFTELKKTEKSDSELIQILVESLQIAAQVIRFHENGFYELVAAVFHEAASS